MKGINIFISDKIRIHALEFTEDGLGMAVGPYFILPLPVADEALLQAVHEAMSHSKSGVPARPLTKEEEKAYHKALGVKSRKELGKGTDVSLDNGRYFVTLFDKRGLFDEPIAVEASDLLETIKEGLGLASAETE